jgi:heptaprenyl diphosphate synthase
MISLEEAIIEVNLKISGTLNRVSGGLNAVTSYLASSKGQGVRAELLLLCASNDEGFVACFAPQVATAIELVHMATLLHDDVIDDAPLRRGQPSVQSKFGKKEAVLVGDYLLCLALNLVANLKLENEDRERFNQMLPNFSQALASVCTGEFEQHRQLNNVRLDLFGYLKIIRGKTAALFYLSAYMGSLLAKDEDKIALALGRFGRQVGLVFQILDDCKDYAMSEQKVGKPVASDLINGVITLPLIMAIKKEPQLLNLTYEVLGGKKDNLSALVQGVQQVGLAHTQRIVQQYINKASNNLKWISPVRAERLMNYLSKWGVSLN